MSMAAPSEKLKAVLMPWRRAMADFKDAAHTVSYTHLTLPTILRV